MTDLARLRVLAEGATALCPSDWTVDRDNAEGIELRDGRGSPLVVLDYTDFPDEMRAAQREIIINETRAFVHFIAACSPSVILKLLDELEALRARQHSSMRE